MCLSQALCLILLQPEALLSVSAHLPTNRMSLQSFLIITLVAPISLLPLCTQEASLSTSIKVPVTFVILIYKLSP